ncbi:threonine aldolase [marine bacterium AO1-C]|nr:threonine aldolase [marine bacterium AO1-C]
MIDLRSDTVTKPTSAMLEAMFSAKVGDDVYDEDETVNALQQKAAALFGMEDALFCPSGTMTNQIAMRIITEPQDEIICYKGAHVYKYEGGGLAYNSQVSTRTINAVDGILKPEDITENINPDNIHYPRTSVVALENSVNRAGGTCYTLQEITDVVQEARKHGLKTHLDGARVFNALIAKGESAQAYGQHFDTISICLSKGLGCPIGSLVIGNKALMKKAKRSRKVLGGAMRQVGYLAAAGIYALDHHVERLAEDHQRAEAIAKHLTTKSYVSNLVAPQTNIVLFDLPNLDIVNRLLEHLKSNGILAGMMDTLTMRFVTHLDFNDDQLTQFLKALDTFEA